MRVIFFCTFVRLFLFISKEREQKSSTTISSLSASIVSLINCTHQHQESWDDKEDADGRSDLDVDSDLDEDVSEVDAKKKALLKNKKLNLMMMTTMTKKASSSSGSEEESASSSEEEDDEEEDDDDHDKEVGAEDDGKQVTKQESDVKAGKGIVSPPSKMKTVAVDDELCSCYHRTCRNILSDYPDKTKCVGGKRYCSISSSNTTTTSKSHGNSTKNMITNPSIV